MSSDDVDQMVPGELARFALLDPEPVEPDDPTCRLYLCARCGNQGSVPFDLDPSRFCDRCAHDMVELLATALVPLTECNPDLKSAIDREFGRALDAAKGNKAKAARLLGVSRYTIHRWIRGERVGGGKLLTPRKQVNT